MRGKVDSLPPASRDGTREPVVSIVIVNWNTRERLRDCLHSVMRCTTADEAEIIVVDNASTDGSVELVRSSFPNLIVEENAVNAGFARAVNRGVERGRGRYVLLLNSDARLTEGALAALVAIASSNPDAAVVGPAVVEPGGRKCGAAGSYPNAWSHLLMVTGIGRRLWGDWYPSDDPRIGGAPRVVDWVGGACMLIRRSIFDALGGLEESYFMFAEEMDFCYRARQHGWQTWHHPSAVIVHEGGGSGAPPGYERAELLFASQILFFERHYGFVSAFILKAETYLAIIAKNAVRAALRFLTGGSYARPGLSLARMAQVRRSPDRVGLGGA